MSGERQVRAFSKTIPFFSTHAAFFTSHASFLDALTFFPIHASCAGVDGTPQQQSSKAAKMQSCCGRNRKQLVGRKKHFKLGGSLTGIVMER